ncbi:TolC family outer membrane protein [Bartonella tamiae]|uniref:TolC family type I secretion outer membrane protein n=1 Tax=Bartonella tamiae Th239 TaxID=1094558 RepID=J0QT12_9HYPH|nr:TolC family outer membrane protein [Bartonella tamiae]EJF89001.1 TolC family type I secretion outer membrane protein [Bartonella tamiae Th239]EJF94749.1 TolC family type I secretion outer membrane protein [Bartonella tamiae Th307]
MVKSKKALLTALLLSGAVFTSGSAHAETLMGALAKAYTNNGNLNSERAGTRILDEDIAIAKSNFRPQIEGFGTYGRGRTPTTKYYTTTGSIGIQLSQKVFDGFVTKNTVASAEVKAQAQREFLRNTEQNILVNAATAYADVFQYRRIADLRRENLAALEEQVRSDRAKLDVGEGTRTDLAQSEAARSVAVSELSLAQADVQSAEAVYRQVIRDDPDKLERPPVANQIPKTPDVGYKIGASTHPAILYARYLIDASSYNVKAKEGALMPQLDISASTSYNETYNGPGVSGTSNSVGLSLNVPIYQGGRTSAQIRQSKEQLGQARIQLDMAQDSVRENLASSWSQLEGARASVIAYRDSVRAAQIALNGRVEENRVGQATTLDVLESRSQLINAQISLVTAERNVVVASYNVQSAIGKMTADRLGLQVVTYNPEEHNRAVKDKWIGLRTPDGR